MAKPFGIPPPCVIERIPALFAPHVRLNAAFRGALLPYAAFESKRSRAKRTQNAATALSPRALRFARRFEQVGKRAHEHAVDNGGGSIDGGRVGEIEQNAHASSTHAAHRPHRRSAHGAVGESGREHHDVGLRHSAHPDPRAAIGRTRCSALVARPRDQSIA